MAAFDTPTTERITEVQPFDVAMANAWSPRQLELTLFPTEQCNFRCVYCYEDFEIGRMKPAVIAGIKSLTSKRADDLSALRITWFGGEPLAARDIVVDLSTHFNGLAAANPEMAYSANMTTNGSLLKTDVCRTLVDLGVREYQISLDGPKSIHDQTRLRMNGSGTFDQIYRNLMAIRESELDLRVMLRLHLTADNKHLMPEFVGHLRDDFLGDSRFVLFFVPIGHLGGPNDDEVLILAPSETNRVIRSLQAIARGTADQPRASAQAATAEDATRTAEDATSASPSIDVCYAAKPNAFTIRADGRVGKCTVALSSRSNDVGTITEDGALLLDGEKTWPWVSGWSTGNLGHLACPLETVPALKDRASPSINPEPTPEFIQVSPLSRDKTSANPG